MKTFFACLFTLATLAVVAQTQPVKKGVAVGDVAPAFSLKNVDGKMVSLADYNTAKGVIVVFTCNACPYAKAYEERIMALDKSYRAKGFPVVAINPNDAKVEPEDSYENMQTRAKEKGYTFPYVLDETQNIARAYGATRTPHIYLLAKQGNDFIVRYIGAIDDNTSEPKDVKTKYVESAIDALLTGKEVAVKETKAIGCTVKWRKS
jgi:peroxiredoxin